MRFRTITIFGFEIHVKTESCTGMYKKIVGGNRCDSTTPREDANAIQRRVVAAWFATIVHYRGNPGLEQARYW